MRVDDADEDVELRMHVDVDLSPVTLSSQPSGLRYDEEPA